MSWKKHQLARVETDQALGPVRIVDDTHPSVLRVLVLGTGEHRQYTKRNPPLKRLALGVGQKLKVSGHEEEVVVRTLELRDGVYFFTADEGAFSEVDVTGLSSSPGLEDLIRQEKLSRPKAFWARQDAWDLLRLRESHPLKGAVGCRVQLLPHQLWVLDSVLKMPRIRALLADEVGLGKTIEAGLIFSALHARRQLKRVLVIVPPALKVQWLTESYRRFNVRFRLDHEELIDEGEFRDFVIASFDELDNNLARFDLLIVDEAHRLAHDPERSEILAKLVAAAKHALFLSATPLVHGQEAFERLLDVLSLTPAGPVEALVFRSERSELGIAPHRRLEAAFVKNKKKWLHEFVAAKVESREKAFLIASDADGVIKLHAELRRKHGERFALFHEGMDLIERDRQAAYFADPEGAQFLVSSEIGGEGRNFQFCRNMVLVDLPSDPLTVEQRIGRLDRLGQTGTVHVWCPVEEATRDEEVFERHRDVYRVFEAPWSGASLEDTEDGDLLASRDGTNVLELLRVPYDAERANALIATVEELARTPIRDFLEMLYDIFGVEAEDFDSRGNLRVFASSLMFVDHFPGLGESGERVFTFDRAQGLAREDLTFFSVDHPDFVESVEFLLSSDQGKLAAVRLPPAPQPDLLLAGLVPASSKEDSTVRVWSCRAEKEIPSPALAELPEAPRHLPPNAAAVVLKGLEALRAARPADEIDALLLGLPTR
jgi:ATP-dependent helicase HepA